jgi:hypothetical protein
VSSFTVRVTGYREAARAFRKAEGDVDSIWKQEMREAGDIVKGDATGRGARYSGIGPYRTAVRQGGVAVEQTAGKVTGARGDFGALQMRNVLEPALEANVDAVNAKVEQGLDRVVGSAGL